MGIRFCTFSLIIIIIIIANHNKVQMEQSLSGSSNQKSQKSAGSKGIPVSVMNVMCDHGLYSQSTEK